jgi:hypothetical protein
MTYLTIYTYLLITSPFYLLSLVMYKFDVKFKHMKQKNDKNYYFLKVWCTSQGLDLSLARLKV